MGMKIDICLPVYNEGLIFNDNASKLLAFLRKGNFGDDWRAVFIVNGSNIEFQQLVQKFVNQNGDDSSIFLIERAGKGRAIKTYFNSSEADILAYMDIDLAVDLNNLPSLLAPILSGEADLCLGSRMLASSRVKRSYLREIRSQAYIFVSRLLLKHRVSDLQCGFKAISAKSWRQLASRIQNNNFFFDTELIYFARKDGLRIKEVAVDWSENRYHLRRSKTNPWRDPALFMWEVWRLWRRK